jgi:hypothetical protein
LVSFTLSRGLSQRTKSHPSFPTIITKNASFRDINTNE